MASQRIADGLRSSNSRDFLAQAASSAALQSALLVSGVLLARTLSVADRGAFGVITGIVASAVQGAGFGIASGLSYFSARGLISHGTWTRLRGPGLIRAGGAGALAGVATMMYKPSLALALASILAAVALLAYHWALGLVQGLPRQNAHAALRACQVAVFSTFLLIAAFLPLRLGLSRVMAIWTGSMLFAGIVTLSKARASVVDLVEGASWSAIRSYSAKGFVAQVSPIETFRVDTFVAAACLSPTDLGLYVAALGFAAAPRFIADTFAAFMFPRISAGRLAAQTRARGFLVYLGASLLAAGALAGAAPLVVPVLLGRDFASTAPLVLPLALTALGLGGKRLLLDAQRAQGFVARATRLELASIPGLIVVILVAAISRDVQAFAWAMAAWAAFSLGAVGWRLQAKPLEGRPSA